MNDAEKLLQERLRAAGYDPGPIDGVIGKNTLAALERALAPPVAADPLMIAELRRDEGERFKPYKDTVGKLTIGVGRNLDDRGITTDESAYLLANDVTHVMRGLDIGLPWWRTLDPVRQRVLINMGFNLGINGLLGFVNTLRMVREKDYAAAAAGMLASKWARQVGDRAKRLAYMMEHGRTP